MSACDGYVPHMWKKDTCNSCFQPKAEHGDAARAVCQKLGAEYLSVTTDEPLDRVLSDFLRQRQHRGKTIQRHANQ